MTVIISKENMGYDISTFDEKGNIVKTTWKSDIGYARECAINFADFYRGEIGQRASIHYAC